jgi:hypothetical protein
VLIRDNIMLLQFRIGLLFPLFLLIGLRARGINAGLHKRMMIESCVFRAVAELLGKDPWDLAPERFRHL